MKTVRGAVLLVAGLAWVTWAVLALVGMNAGLESREAVIVRSGAFLLAIAASSALGVLKK